MPNITLLHWMPGLDCKYCTLPQTSWLYCPFLHRCGCDLTLIFHLTLLPLLSAGTVSRTGWGVWPRTGGGRGEAPWKGGRSEGGWWPCLVEDSWGSHAGSWLSSWPHPRPGCQGTPPVWCDPLHPVGGAGWPWSQLWVVVSLSFSGLVYVCLWLSSFFQS